MEKQFTNRTGLTEAFAIWLVQDDYDYDDDPRVISATSLIKPVRKAILEKRAEKDVESVVDIADLVSSRLGQAIHLSLEQAWSDRDALKKGFALCGIPARIADGVVVNPTEEDFLEDPDLIPVYTEQRLKKELVMFKNQLKSIVSGKYDLVVNGRICDYKSTSTWTYVKQRNNHKYILQMSIYRWLAPDVITEDVMQVNYVFTDWSKLEAIKQPQTYPQTRVISEELQLMSLEETEAFVKSAVKAYNTNFEKDEGELPECPKEELWCEEDKWKYYADENKTSGRSTKNFTNEAEALQFKADKGKGVVLYVQGKAKACNYCSGRNLCSQADRMAEAGLL